MLNFILNNHTIETGVPSGITVLDFVRYGQNLKGTKIGCREGDCGACTILIGELKDDRIEYRSMTSCLMPLANAHGKHIVTVEGINRKNGKLTPVQQALVVESGTQCGFCTVGFIMSMTGFCVDDTEKSCEMAVSAIDGNICRCTGYKSIERAVERISEQLGARGEPSTVSNEESQTCRDGSDWLRLAIQDGNVPEYFSGIKQRLGDLKNDTAQIATRNPRLIVGGGTDLYVQKHDEMAESEAAHVFYDEELRGIREVDGFVEIGGSATVTDLLVSPIMRRIFFDLNEHLKLVSSTPIRNMATIAGNIVNASPIGDMTIWFLALDADIFLSEPEASANEAAGSARTISLKDFFLGYKQLAKSDTEIIKTIRFRKPVGYFRFNFEKVSKRTYLDIATVNTAISINVNSPNVNAGLNDNETDPNHSALIISNAHVAAGGVSPIPLYLRKTSSFLVGKKITSETIAQASEIMQDEIAPISDVRGTESYKRLLLKQLFVAHFVEVFGFKP